MNEDKGRITIRTAPMDADTAQGERVQTYLKERKRTSITATYYQLIHRLTPQSKVPKRSRTKLMMRGEGLRRETSFQLGWIVCN